MRKSLGLGIVTAMLLSMFGCYLFFTGAVTLAKLDAGNELKQCPVAALTEFKFTAEEFASLSRPEGDDSEVVIADELYDVKTVQASGDKIIVYAYRDADETDLVGYLVNWINSHTKHGSHGPVTQSFFMPYYTVNVFNWAITLPVLVTTLQTQADKTLAGTPAGILLPPPNQVTTA